MSFDRANGIAPSMLELVGETPMVYLTKLNTTQAKIALKLESENPMASVKDRLAMSIILNAEKDGKITRGKSTLVEATSGNTGIALAQLGAALGYKVVLTMPETMSQERRALLHIFGAEVILTPGPLGMKGALTKASKVVAERPGAFLTRQFETEYNAKVHRETTGEEIWKQTKGEIDIFVAGVGTGGTLTGVAQALKAHKPDVLAYAVEPDESAVLSGEKPGPHPIQGIGAGFVPAVVDRSVVDGVVRVKGADALATARLLPANEGLFAGISSGAAVKAALELGERPENAGKLIVAVIPSFGERYLSTGMFQGLREEVAKWPVTPLSEFQ